MAKLSDQSAIGVSFYNVEIFTSVNKLIEALGTPKPGDDKSHYMWTCETEEGDVFMVYDWNEYRFGNDVKIYFHIGAHDKAVSLKAREELKTMGI